LLTALEMDMERKPTPNEWLAQDAWFDSLMREVHQAFEDGYRESHGTTERRLPKPTQGPQRPDGKGTR
jgi:hypothetical protein